jgi:hypothetical protein
VVVLAAAGVTVTVGVMAGELPVPLVETGLLDPPHPIAAQAAIQRNGGTTHAMPGAHVMLTK